MSRTRFPILLSLGLPNTLKPLGSPAKLHQGQFNNLEACRGWLKAYAQTPGRSPGPLRPSARSAPGSAPAPLDLRSPNRAPRCALPAGAAASQLAGPGSLRGTLPLLTAARALRPSPSVLSPGRPRREGGSRAKRARRKEGRASGRAPGRGQRAGKRGSREVRGFGFPK